MDGGLPQNAIKYFAVVGVADDTLLPSVGQKLPVKVLQRYPQEDHKDARLPPALASFCFPRGGAQVVAPEAEVVETLHGFVLTNESGDRCFGAALHIWCLHPSRTCLVQKALAVLSHHPLWGAFRSFLHSLLYAASPEKLIVNFVSETPLPPPGSLVQVSLPQAELELRSPAPNQLPLLDLPVRLMFQKLTPDCVVSLVEALLLEQRIVLYSQCAGLSSFAVPWSGLAGVSHVTYGKVLLVFQFLFVQPAQAQAILFESTAALLSQALTQPPARPRPPALTQPPALAQPPFLAVPQPASPRTLGQRSAPKLGILYWGCGLEGRGWDLTGRNPGGFPRIDRSSDALVDSWKGRMENAQVTLRMCASEGPGFKRYVKHFMMLSAQACVEFRLQQYHRHNTANRRKVLTERIVIGGILETYQRRALNTGMRISNGEAGYLSFLRRRCKRYKAQAAKLGGHFAAVILEGGHPELTFQHAARAKEGLPGRERQGLKRLLLILGGPDGVPDQTRVELRRAIEEYTDYPLLGLSLPGGILHSYYALATVLVFHDQALLLPFLEQRLKDQKDSPLSQADKAPDKVPESPQLAPPSLKAPAPRPPEGVRVRSPGFRGGSHGSPTLRCPNAGLSVVCAFCEILVGLIWPLRPAAVYVPLLPNALVDFCGAPLPFVLGISSDMVARAEAMCEPHTLFANIDTSEVRESQESSLCASLVSRGTVGPRPLAPERPKKKLMNRIKMALKGQDFQAQEQKHRFPLPLSRNALYTVEVGEERLAVTMKNGSVHVEPLTGRLTRLSSAPALGNWSKPWEGPCAVDLHSTGQCMPCIFFHRKADGCRKGDTCSHCHLCTAQEMKRRKHRRHVTARAAVAAAPHGAERCDARDASLPVAR
ncbi:unnamed protein product [Effrenium voratum]|nr:unnamed protein product [Effrenium voratum]